MSSHSCNQVPGGTDHRTENHIFMAVFLGNRVELFRELSSANTSVEGKVVKWACFVLRFFFQKSFCVIFPSSLPQVPPPLTLFHVPLCPQLAGNQTFSAYHCLDHACLSSGISSLNHQPFPLQLGPIFKFITTMNKLTLAKVLACSHLTQGVSPTKEPCSISTTKRTTLLRNIHPRV